MTLLDRCRRVEAFNLPPPLYMEPSSILERHTDGSGAAIMVPKVLILLAFLLALLPVSTPNRRPQNKASTLDALLLKGFYAPLLPPFFCFRGAPV